MLVLFNIISVHLQSPAEEIKPVSKPRPTVNIGGGVTVIEDLPPDSDGSEPAETSDVCNTSNILLLF